jgi:hypothetical protein
MSDYEDQAFAYATRKVNKLAKDPCYFCDRNSDCEECSNKH